MAEIFLERMEVMFQQEEVSYQTVDYLLPEFQRKLALVCDRNQIEVSGSKSNESLASSSSGINDVWREKIVEWSYQVIDHFDFSREVVSISIHYLDRFLSTRPCNKKVFQLAAMTSLFIAIKLYEPGKLSMQSMIELSRGYFTVQQMQAMEMSLLRALSWKMHPPTAYCFGKHLLHLLPYSAVSMDDRQQILELARFLTELSVIDYFFVVYKPSVVAWAAILNAMDEIPGAHCAIPGLCVEVYKSTPLNASKQELKECRDRLRSLYSQGDYSSSASDPGSMQGSERVSPVCVASYGAQTARQVSYVDSEHREW